MKYICSLFLTCQNLSLNSLTVPEYIRINCSMPRSPKRHANTFNDAIDANPPVPFFYWNGIIPKVYDII